MKQVNLSWTWTEGTGHSADGWNVYRSTVSGGPYSLIANVPIANGPQYLDQSSPTNQLVPQMTYYYVVSALGAAGESLPSNEVGVKIHGTPPLVAPTDLGGVSS